MVSTKETLHEVISGLAPGDLVTAEFTDDRAGDFVVTGRVWLSFFGPWRALKVGDVALALVLGDPPAGQPLEGVTQVEVHQHAEAGAPA